MSKVTITSSTIKTSQSGIHIYYVDSNGNEGDIYFSKGNRKVEVPIVSTSSGTKCPNAKICPFHTSNYKKANFPECYACKTERIYKGAKATRDLNEACIDRAYNLGYGYELGELVGKYMVEACVKLGVKYIRFNESGDLADWNIDFIKGLTISALSNGVGTYGYSKSSSALIESAESVGAIIMRSEYDFVMVRTEAEAEEKGLELCPGIGCGLTCIRCPLKIRTAVLAH